MSNEQADTQGQTTYNKDDKHPHRRKVQRAKQDVPAPVKTMTVTIAPQGRKYVYSYERRYPRKNLPLSEKSQVTIGKVVYKKSNAREDSPLHGKWYKLYKGESIEDAIKKRGEKEVLVDSPPIEEKEG
jgi:hypothetical protein